MVALWGDDRTVSRAPLGLGVAARHRLRAWGLVACVGLAALLVWGSASAATPATASAPDRAAGTPGHAAGPERRAPRAPGSATATDDDDELPFRLSLPTESDRAAWKRPGFRVEVGLRYGLVRGLAGLPGGEGFGVATRMGVRVDEDWSLLLGFSYGAATGQLGTGLAGLRYLVTAEPVWHLTERWSLAFGLGLAGFVEGGSGRDDPDAAGRDALVAPYTFPAGSKAMPSCNGAGAGALLRLGWTVVLGPLSATTFSAQVDAQQTLCVDDTGRVEPDTAEPIVRRQWWQHVGASLGWSFSWR